MKLLLIVLPLLFPRVLFPQKAKSVIPEDSVISKWTKATIHIEVRDTDEQNEESMLLYRKRSDKIITENEYRHLQDSIDGIRKGGTGTAIFLLHNTHHFLITARHVLEGDSILSKFDIARKKVILIENGSFALDSNVSDNKERGVLFNLLSNIDDTLFAFVMSSKEDDLALISLEKTLVNGYFFVETLYGRGYIPIEIKDIDTTYQIKKSDEVIAFGFPDLSVLANKLMPQGYLQYQSPLVTLPVITKGHIDATIKHDNFLAANIAIYKGFSGGALVRNNKLIGINQSMRVIERKLNREKLKYYRREYSYFIKSSFIMKFLRELDGSVKSAFNFKNR